MILDKQKFQQWLKGKNSSEVVAESCKENICPIANFLKETYKYFYVEVNYFSFKVRYEFQPIEVHNMPDWSKNFIDYVDELDTTITAEQALSYLK